MPDPMLKIDCIISHCPLHGIQVVPPIVSPRAKIALIGEMPGIEDLERGKPFSGPAGSRMTDAVREAGLDPYPLFISHAAKCWFDQDLMNPDLLSLILKSCRAYLSHALLELDLRVIITAGDLAASQITGSEKTVARGEWMESEEFDCLVMPTFSSDRMLKNRDIYKLVVEDLKKVAAYAVSGFSDSDRVKIPATIK